MPLSDSDCGATYKVLVLGDSSVGKTALLRCLTGKPFQEKLLPTIVTDFVTRKFEVDGALVELQIWDTAGQERFHSMNRWQYNGVKGVVMVYDITDRSTFTHLPYWMQSVNNEMSHLHNKYEVVPIVLLGNKCDLETNRSVTTREGRKLAEKELTFGFFETSAKTGEQVFDAFRKLAYHVTEICNPQLMKSYHPHLIRQPTPTASKPEKTTRRKFPQIKMNVADNRVTIKWNTITKGDTCDKSKNKTKSGTKCEKTKSARRRRFQCCCFPWYSKVPTNQTTLKPVSTETELIS